MRSISASSYGSVVLAVLIHTRVESSESCSESILINWLDLGLDNEPGNGIEVDASTGFTRSSAQRIWKRLRAG